MSKNLQLFVPTFRVEECLSEIRECLEKGWTGLGFKTVQFEEKWKEYTGLENAHFLNSATVGLDMAINILKESKAAYRLNFKHSDEICSLTGHTRHSTQGSEKHNFNNHPFFGKTGECNYKDCILYAIPNFTCL